MRKLLLLIVLILLLTACSPIDPLTDPLYSTGNISTTSDMGASSFIGGNVDATYGFFTQLFTTTLGLSTNNVTDAYIHNLYVDNIVSDNISGTGNVTADNVLTNNTIIRGDGGGLGVQDSTATIDDTGKLEVAGDAEFDQDVYIDNDLFVTNDVDVGDNLDVGGDLTVTGSLIAPHASTHETGGSDELSTWSLLNQKDYFFPVNAGWWIQSSGSGTYIDEPTRIALFTGATTLSDVAANTPPIGLSATSDEYIDWDEDFKFRGLFGAWHYTDPTNQESWIHFTQSIPIPRGDLTNRGIGINIKYKDATNTHNLYITSHDGTTYSEYDTNFQCYGLHKIEIIFTAGTSVEVLVNDVSKGTKTTNIPAGDFGARWGIATDRFGGAATDAYAGCRLLAPQVHGSY